MKTITSAELDEKFDRGEDISEHLDWSSARRGDHWQFVDLNLQNEMLSTLDEEAKRLGLSRQGLVTIWIRERLEGLRAPK